jgi:hypothetical protein
MCKEEKDLTEFGKDKYQKDGHNYSCKLCKNTKYNTWARNNKDKVQVINLLRKPTRDAYYKSPRGQEGYRRSHLKRTYNMTLDEYDAILESQGGVCEICKSPETHKRNSFLAVDHCHETNKIRGLLCSHCNRSIGILKENIETLQNMIEYIKKHKQ